MNDEVCDDQSLCVGDLVVNHWSSSMYLCSPITSDGSVTTSVKEHATDKLGQVLKFITFPEKHYTVPFIVKRRIFEVAVTSSLLY